MNSVVLDITVSLDGFVAPPDDDVTRLQQWLFGGDTPSTVNGFFKPSKGSAGVFDKLLSTTGSAIAGRRLYDLTDGWSGNFPVADRVFVLSHHVPNDIPRGSTTFSFVTDGIESIVRQAKAAAGDKNVYVVGGASVAQQIINARLLDEIMLHVVPVLLGKGIRLFENLEANTIELEQTSVVETREVTHLGYRVVK